MRKTKFGFPIFLDEAHTDNRLLQLLQLLALVRRVAELHAAPVQEVAVTTIGWHSTATWPNALDDARNVSHAGTNDEGETNSVKIVFGCNQITFKLKLVAKALRTDART